MWVDSMREIIEKTSDFIKGKTLSKEVENEFRQLIYKRAFVSLKLVSFFLVLAVIGFSIVDFFIISDTRVLLQTNLVRLLFIFGYLIPFQWLLYKRKKLKNPNLSLIGSSFLVGLFLGILSLLSRDYSRVLINLTIGVFLMNIGVYIIFGIHNKWAVFISLFYLFLINLNYQLIIKVDTIPIGAVSLNIWFVLISLVGAIGAKNIDAQLRNSFLVTIELHKANQAKYQLFNMVSHDLKNMIAAQYTIAECLKEDDKELKFFDHQKMISILYHSASEVMNLFEELMAWIKTQLDTLKPSIKIINVGFFHESIQNQMQPALENKQMQLVIESESKSTMITDSNILGLILRNIIGNSIKFSYSGSTVIVKHLVTNNWIEYQIIDTGVGIEAGKLNKLFNSPELNSGTGTNGEKGTGLGLILTRELIQYLHGTIDIQSSLQQGTKIVIGIPNNPLLTQIEV